MTFAMIEPALVAALLLGGGAGPASGPEAPRKASPLACASTTTARVSDCCRHAFHPTTTPAATHDHPAPAPRVAADPRRGR